MEDPLLVEANVAEAMAVEEEEGEGEGEEGVEVGVGFGLSKSTVVFARNKSLTLFDDQGRAERSLFLYQSSPICGVR